MKETAREIEAKQASLLAEYKRLAFNVHTSLTPVSDTRRMRELRALLGINLRPKNMQGWASSSVENQRARTALEVI